MPRVWPTGDERVVDRPIDVGGTDPAGRATTPGGEAGLHRTAEVGRVAVSAEPDPSGATWLRTDPDGVVLSVRVQPGARRAGLTGRHGDALALRVTAPPVEGRANEAVLDAIAELLGVRRSEVSLRRGATSRAKQVHVRGVDPVAVVRRIEHLLGDAGTAP
jgi:uncharacterized protein (TIGR00251 family)